MKCHFVDCCSVVICLLMVVLSPLVTNKFSGDALPSSCSGDINDGTDYCYDPLQLLADNPDLTGLSTDSFRLKLYWEEGYRWQDEAFERECTFLSGALS